jgi:hypothetical protein
LWSEGIWLVWGRNGKQTDDETENDKILLDQLRKLTQLETASEDFSNLAPDQLMAAKSAVPFDAGDADILSMPQSTRSRSKKKAKAIKPQENNEQMLEMVKACGVPRSKLETLIQSLKTEKVSSQKPKVKATSKNNKKEKKVIFKK